MVHSLPFDEAWSYYHLRAPYAAQTYDSVCEALGLSERSRILDLGCGIGTLAIPFARRLASVLAIDRNRLMLDEGCRRADADGLTNITWACMPAEEVTDTLGQVDGVVMGQSFHWMRRDLVLKQLAPMIREGGGIALIGPSLKVRTETTEALLNPILE